jgi:hypothetical protein
LEGLSLFKIRRIFAALLFAAAFVSSSAWALEPQDALSSCPEESFYVTLRVNDLGGIARRLFSPTNLELIASSLPAPSDAQGVRLVGSYLSRISAKSVAAVFGVTTEMTPFAQVAASMPEELRSRLDRVAEGKADASDLTALLLGDDSPLSSALMSDATSVRQGREGPYYALEGTPLALSAKDGLLLIASSPEHLDASKEAMEEADKRLAVKRRFESPNYCAFHVDWPTLRKLAEMNGDDGKEMEPLLKLFKAPLVLELAFDSRPGSFLVSSAMNLLESFAAVESLDDWKPAKSGGLFFAGGGKPYFGLGFLMNFDPDRLADIPEVLAGWRRLTEELTKEGISTADLLTLLKGKFSIVASGSADFFGQPGPGISVALTGRDGAAGSFLNSILKNEKFTASTPLSPVKMQGWEMLFQVDPAILPGPFFVGVKGETLFLGVLDPNEMGKEPDFSPDLTELLAENSFATAFLDVPTLWEHLRSVLLAKNSRLAREPIIIPYAANILEGEPPVGLIKGWTPTLETSFLEFQWVDVPPGKELFPRLLSAAKTAFGANEREAEVPPFPFGSEESQPLLLLMVAKGAVEEALEGDPDADLDDLREDLADFAVILKTESGEIYVGTRVSDEEKPLMREQAAYFDLLGSSDLTRAPDGTPYSDQEAAWLKVDLPQ